MEAAPSCYVPRRYLMAALLTISNIICYADRINIGIAILEFDLSEYRAGLVLSAFFYGYIFTQIPGGWLSSRYGGKIVLLVGVIVWTFFDFATIFAEPYFALLMAVRIGMGLGEGVNFPSVHALSASWIPLSERSTLVTAISSGQDLGSILAVLLSPQIAAAWGWRGIFVAFSIAAATWAAAFALLASSRPEDHPSISREEVHLITNNRGFHHHSTDTSILALWRRLLRCRGVYAIILAQLGYVYGLYILLLWTPKYFTEQFDINMSKQPLYASMPYLAGLVGMLASGIVSDALLNRGIFTVVTVRRIMNTVGMCGAAVFLCILQLARTPLQATLLMSCTFFFSRITLAGYWVNMIDVAPRNAGQMMGLSNTFGTIPGIVGNIVTGSILSVTGSWAMVFGIAVLAYLVGAVLFLVMATAAPIDMAPEEDFTPLQEITPEPTRHIPAKESCHSQHRLSG